MWSLPEQGRFRTRRRPALELGMTPLIDIVFLLLIFFMLTSRFVVHEGIQVDLPVTESSHFLPAGDAHRITVRSEDVMVMSGRLMTLVEVERYIQAQDAAFIDQGFEILADRDTSVQTVISLLEVLRRSGALRVNLRTVNYGEGAPSP